jgi:hypothetical protein
MSKSKRTPANEHNAYVKMDWSDIKHYMKTLGLNSEDANNFEEILCNLATDSYNQGYTDSDNARK